MSNYQGIYLEGAKASWGARVGEARRAGPISLLIPLKRHGYGIRCVLMSSDVFGLVGTILRDQYRVDSVVGEGGFGVIYRGFHLSLERSLGIKCLKMPEHFTAEAKRLFFEKFREEGKLLCRLADHPSIVHVYDFGVFKGPANADVPYLVLEWLEGHDLELELAQRSRPYADKEAFEILRPVIEALSFAHEKGIIHRDLKPANLYLTQGGRGPTVKVLDFGIAKAMQEGETLTQRTAPISTAFSAFSPQYGAPEQFISSRFGPTGKWTDVHALGLILVEMVTGKHALGEGQMGDLLLASIGENRPSARAMGVRVSDDFERICAKALARMSSERYQDAGELLSAFQNASFGLAKTQDGDISGISSTQPPSRQANHSDSEPSRGRGTRFAKKWWPFLLGAALTMGIGAAAIGIWALRGRDSQGEKLGTTLQSIQPVQAQGTSPSASTGQAEVLSGSATPRAVPPSVMIAISGGTFEMGSEANGDEKPLDQRQLFLPADDNYFCRFVADLTASR